VVYVMGAGHSGSTILGVALGNFPGFFYAGEVEEWLAASARPARGGSQRNAFWTAVREEMQRTPADDVFGTEVNRLIERSSALLRVDRWAARRRLLARYRTVAENLFRAIARTAGATHVVDTSHFPLRARQLHKSPGIELYLVLLVRDAQDVIASNLRPISRRDVAGRRLLSLSTNAGLWLTHLLSIFVFTIHPRDRRVFVRYEDFAADPRGVLRAIIDCIEPSLAVPDVNALRTGEPFQGNSLIDAQTIAVRQSTSPSKRRSWLTALWQAPWDPVLSRLRPAARSSDAPPRSADPKPSPAPPTH